MFNSLFIAFFVAAFHSVQLLPFIDNCLQVKVKEDFDPHRFNGKWYEILRSNISVPVVTKCHEENYITDDKFVIISGAFMNKMTKNYTSTEGIGAIHRELPAKLTYDFPTAHAIGELSVIDTDYETYAALFVCNTYEIVKLEHFWIVSRTRKLSDDIVKMLLSKYEAMGGDISRLIYIDQSDC